jgi:hypothetical protein
MLICSYKVLLRAYGDQYTSHLAKSSTLKQKRNPERSKFSKFQGSEQNNFESVRSETVLSDRNLNSKVLNSNNSNGNLPLEYQTRDRNGAMFYSDVENQNLPGNKRSPI